jgi:MFS family permease
MVLSQTTHLAETTAVASFMLVCDDAWKAPAITSVYFLGFFVGSGYFGAMGDQKGRRPSYQLLTLAAPCAILCTALSTNFVLHLIARSMCGILIGGIMTVSYVYFSEFVGADYRQVCGIGSMAFFAAGYMLLSPLAYITGSWRLCTGK